MRLVPTPLLLTTLAAALLLAGTRPALAQYTWKDGQGQVHVSDMPPPREIPDKDVLKRPAAATRQTQAAATPASAAASASPLTKPPTDPELEARRKRADTDARARARADEEAMALQRADNCARARQQLQLFDSGERLVLRNAKGERQVVDDAMRSEQTQTARRVIASDCR